MRFSLAATFLFVWSTAAQSISTILPEQNGLSTFTAYVNQFPELLALLDGGNFTVLAPTDDAFAFFLGSETDINATDTDELEALLQYHVLRGLHPSLSFASSSQFLPTLLTNNNYTNVTGGQRVEVGSQNGTVSIYSAIKALSTIVTADTLFVGGIIHTIDRVLAIPDTIPTTISKAGLNDLIALLSKDNLLTEPGVFATVADLHDLTVFACNDPQYGESFTAWDTLSNQALLDIIEYALVDGIVAYSPSLTNQSTFKTEEGEVITITVIDGATYVDASKITSPNYLTSNGVMHILDAPLNPNATNARPTIAAGPTSPNSGLSRGAKALISIAVAVVSLSCLVCFVFMMRAREQKRLQRRRRQQQSPNHSQRPPLHVHEKEVEQHTVWELDGIQRPDPCARVRSSLADSRRAGRPIFKTFSIHL